MKILDKWRVKATGLEIHRAIKLGMEVFMVVQSGKVLATHMSMGGATSWIANSRKGV